MLDSRPRGRGFEPHQCHCVVSLSKKINPSLVLVQPRKTRPFITERLLMGRKESNQTNKQEGNVIWHKTLRMLKFHPITAFMKTYIYKLQKIFLCPQRNFRRHIVIALSIRPCVRPCVRPSRFVSGAYLLYSLR